MKKSYAGLLGLMLTSAIAFSASAADLGRGGYKDGPVYAAVDWTGLYAGFNAGGGGTSNDGVLSPSGGFAGGQVGYNWQGVFGMSHNWVVGLEADIQGSGIDDSSALLGLKSSLNWFGTLRGRIGYAFGPTLVYGTGGFAFGEVENTVVPFRVSETQTGYVVGGGVEHKFSPTWSVKAEYQFISLDAGSLSGAGPLGFTLGDRSEINTFRVGLNYRFGHTYDVLK
jgi:outer membrane immunogenic protein